MCTFLPFSVCDSRVTSLYGMLLENGPLHVAANYSIVSNPFSWSSLADTIWIDQPVGAPLPKISATVLLCLQGLDSRPPIALDTVRLHIYEFPLLFSTLLEGNLVPDEDQMAEDFLQFLSNLVQIFPSLSKRPLYLMGESYAGTYIVEFPAFLLIKKGLFPLSLI